MPNINVVDESTSGAVLNSCPLETESLELTVGELIALRVRAEVRRYNNRKSERYFGLVQPTDVEAALNGAMPRKFKPIDADAQVEIALKGFQAQRFVVLLPNGQAESLSEKISLADGDSVSFLKLVPLIGG